MDPLRGSPRIHTCMVMFLRDIGFDCLHLQVLAVSAFDHSPCLRAQWNLPAAPIVSPKHPLAGVRWMCIISIRIRIRIRRKSSIIIIIIIVIEAGALGAAAAAEECALGAAAAAEECCGAAAAEEECAEAHGWRPCPTARTCEVCGGADRDTRAQTNYKAEEMRTQGISCSKRTRINNLHK